MRVLFVVTVTVIMGACATTDSAIYSHTLQNCLSHLSAFKKEVKRQQVSDVQVVSHLAFPYLAFDRFSQSQLAAVVTDNDRSQWLDYTAQLAARQRQAEFNNLVVNHFELPVLDHCASKLTEEAKHNDQVWSAIVQQEIAIADSYETWLRVFGLYPISSQLAQSAINKEKKRILLGFHTPQRSQPTVQYRLAQRPSKTNQLASATHTQAPRANTTINQTQIEAWFNRALSDSTLNWPMLSDSQISQLHTYYAPLIAVEQSSGITFRPEDNIPGAVRYLPLEEKPAVDTSQPAIYLHHSYTRLYGKTYLQLNYSLWFANRTPTSSLDPYAGQFDGVLLRLTLDHRGRPLLLDSIHHCGCYHMVFNLSENFTFANASPDIETPLLFERIVPSYGTMPPSWSVTLSHGEHMIKQLDWHEKSPAMGAKPHALEPIDYDQLRQLPTSKQNTISLFDQRGLLPSSERLESTYLWPFGIPSAGATRQLGHHAIAFIGIRYFDQPRLFEQIVRPVNAP
ncbi:hypothetical protein RJ45_18055 [Photobacterium gaetbulicola]|uniref:Uncharacterized protein n=1 Tax=Photobacterium gaetbulicola TaxID=1295392 RepID=A0A0B9GU28_9GAMM|nr:hypothetical protein [Photobacterium gaetbulicola]KHT62286.1 hypothetical protein RJ45_18055 [Photobacterium gaetbulicola]